MAYVERINRAIDCVVSRLGEPGGLRLMESAIHHLSLYDRGRERVCADMPVPASGAKVALGKDPLPVVAIRGDTLALLEPSEDATGPNLLIRRFRTEPAQCEWKAIACQEAAN